MILNSYFTKRDKEKRRVLFEKVQHTGDCQLNGRLADDQTNLHLKSN